MLKCKAVVDLLLKVNKAEPVSALSFVSLFPSAAASTVSAISFYEHDQLLMGVAVPSAIQRRTSTQIGGGLVMGVLGVHEVW